MGCPHVMVLDTIKDGKFIFKNTRSENKKFVIDVNHNCAPDEFFFVHIKIDLNRLDRIRQRFGVPTIEKKARKRKNKESEVKKTDSKNQLKNDEFPLTGATSKDDIEIQTSSTCSQNHKRSNSKILEINQISQKFTEIIGYRYKLNALDQDDFTTVYVSNSVSSKINKIKGWKTMSHSKVYPYWA